MGEEIIKDSVLVTGATGFVGRSLLKFLKKEKYDTIPLVRSSHGLPNEIVLDFTDENFCQKVKKIPRVNTIIHLGTRVDWKASKSDLFIPNVLTTANLVNWATRIDAQFIFTSTIIVCGKNNRLITKHSVPNPDTNYAYSKWLAEETIKMSGVEHLILRISGIYGKNGSGHLGINNAIADALQGKLPTQFGRCDSKRNYIYIEDLCEIIMNCLKRKVTGMHLVAGSEVVSISEMLKTICDVFLPGKNPIYKPGGKCFDQIVEHSEELISGRKFCEALRHIKREIENDKGSSSR